MESSREVCVEDINNPPKKNMNVFTCLFMPLRELEIIRISGDKKMSFYKMRCRLHVSWVE